MYRSHKYPLPGKMLDKRLSLLQIAWDEVIVCSLVKQAPLLHGNSQNSTTSPQPSWSLWVLFRTLTWIVQNPRQAKNINFNLKSLSIQLMLTWWLLHYAWHSDCCGLGFSTGMSRKYFNSGNPQMHQVTLVARFYPSCWPGSKSSATSVHNKPRECYCRKFKSRNV